MFGWLVFGFHVLEEMGKHLIHGKGAAGAFHQIRLDDLLGLVNVNLLYDAAAARRMVSECPDCSD